MARPAVALIAGIVIGGALGGGVAAATSSSTTVPTAAATAAPQDTAAPIVDNSVPDVPVTSYTPTPADFSLRAKILKKDCFGSAGCNVTYRILVNYTGAALDPTQTWEVTYKVSGDESGPQINTLKITGDQSEVDQEDTLSTSGTHFPKILVMVTDVSGPF